MTDDLFSAGFSWTDEPVSHADATSVATRESVIPAMAQGPRGGGTARLSQAAATGDAIPSTAAPTPADAAFLGSRGETVAGVAGVAGVAETIGQRLERMLSQTLVARSATPGATAEMADFSVTPAQGGAGVADVASVAVWSAGVATLIEGRVPPGIGRVEWLHLVRDAGQLMRLWGHDLHAAGWSACDVFGVEPNLSHRRVDRLGLVAFIGGGEVEAIDRDTAVTRHGKSWLTYYRHLRGEGSVPLWLISEGEIG